MRLSRRKLKPEEKVNMAINMTDVCIQICADAIKEQNKNITEAQLIKKSRERMMSQKRRYYEV